MTRIDKILYRRLVPKFVRKAIDNRRTKNTILNYYDQLPETGINEEEQTALAYLRKNSLCVFPYPFQEQYNRNDIAVYEDEKLNLKYVLLDGKRLYFKRNSSTRGIKRNYNFLLIEQDMASPHRYLTDDFDVNNQDILVDVGAAEGNLALSVIEKVKKVYLFETDKKWIEALEATFSPWKDKVEIVNKFVSNRNDAEHVSLDQFFKDKEVFNFLKIDAEGAESDIFDRCETLLSSAEKLKIAVCCYHKPDDAKIFQALLMGKDFSVSFSEGYMIFNEPKTFSPPYLRKGVLRAEKNVFQST